MARLLVGSSLECSSIALSGSQRALMFEKLCDNLNILMTEMHISADELARRTTIPASTIKKIRNRYNPNPTLSTLLPLAQFFCVSLSQLVGDEPLPTTRLKGLYQETTPTKQTLPILNWQEASQWPFALPETKPTISTDFQYTDKAFALTVEEPDWENLSQGTILLIDPGVSFEHRDLIVVLKEGQPSASLKQALVDEGHVYLKPLIQGYQITALNEQYTVLGVVMEYKKNLRMTDKKLDLVDA